MKKPSKILLIGSGPLQIGQAGEFDYSGSQALKALREEGVASVLVNPNVATVQTNDNLADRVYLQPIEPEIIAAIIRKEQVDGVLLGFGGQSALNCGLALHDQGVFADCGVQVLGTSIESIRATEDRRQFADRLRGLGIETARSFSCASIDRAREVIASQGLPAMLRLGFALGGRGSGIVEFPEDVEPALKRAFANSSGDVVVEESLRGWKEIEYEIVRDRSDNCIAVCNMENVDPMGIHTGESIVVAPSQTLDDGEYQMLRSAAIRIAREFAIIGECNVQFALDPRSRRYRVIEINARLSRSSALASKATGYPLAYVAARIALGHLLADIPNSITKKTTAFFEPALDYLVCKLPRWDLTKFSGSVKTLGSEMKSVGEVMAIGRTFPEALQKGLRMLDIGAKGLDPELFQFEDIRHELRYATPRRIFAAAAALRDGMDIAELHSLTGIDPWFLHGMRESVVLGESIRWNESGLDPETLKRAKRLGFSDQRLDELTDLPKGTTRRLRSRSGIRPNLAKIDTTAAEFPAQTNYLYSTYFATASESKPGIRPRILILGSGVFRIGSSVEFDWSCVSAALAAAQSGYETIMLNYNPETVSTDYDVCDELVFDEISFESVLDLCDAVQPVGTIVSMGGQVANNLALRLEQAGVRIIGTSAENIDRAEDRAKFGQLLDQLAIEQPLWQRLTDVTETGQMVEDLGGFPLLVRPSYVLSGAAMNVANQPAEFLEILRRAKRVSTDHPVVVTKFETHAKEFEIDAVAIDGQVELWSICEHIENAGVHSGDATMVMPPQSLYLPTIRRARAIVAQLAAALKISGPFNVQFIAKNNNVKVIECNLRASRSLPFVSKVLGVNLAAYATQRMLGACTPRSVNPLDLDYVGVKAPMFSFSRLAGVDPLLGVEMASTGEVGCLAEDIHWALLAAARSTGFRTPTAGVLLSLGRKTEKFLFSDEARILAEELSLPIFATSGTSEALKDLGIAHTVVAKDSDTPGGAVHVIERGLVDFVVNIPRFYDSLGRPDGYAIRRAAIDCSVPLVTDLNLARALVEMLRKTRGKSLKPWAVGDFPRPGTARASQRPA
jgi:carbamoyl-phosphate synthase large subunit